ncbi:MAG: DUF4224 domain-containing protein, partial [Gammaproteobacteria bacterium]
MSELLTTEELEKLTGAKQPAKQASILRRHGIFFCRASRWHYYYDMVPC